MLKLIQVVMFQLTVFPHEQNNANRKSYSKL